MCCNQCNKTLDLSYQTSPYNDFHFLAYNGFLQFFRPLVAGVKRKNFIIKKIFSVFLWHKAYKNTRAEQVWIVPPLIGAALSAPLTLPPASVVQGGVGSGILYNVMTCDLPDVIHTNHSVSMQDTDHHCSKDGKIVTFVDDSTSYYAHHDPAEVTRITNKNFEAIEVYMNANQLKINSDKTRGLQQLLQTLVCKHFQALFVKNPPWRLSAILSHVVETHW